MKGGYGYINEKKKAQGKKLSSSERKRAKTSKLVKDLQRTTIRSRRTRRTRRTRRSRGRK